MILKETKHHRSDGTLKRIDEFQNDDKYPILRRHYNEGGDLELVEDCDGDSGDTIIKLYYRADKTIIKGEGINEYGKVTLRRFYNSNKMIEREEEYDEVNGNLIKLTSFWTLSPESKVIFIDANIPGVNTIYKANQEKQVEYYHPSRKVLVRREYFHATGKLDIVEHHDISSENSSHVVKTFTHDDRSLKKSVFYDLESNDLRQTIEYHGNQSVKRIQIFESDDSKCVCELHYREDGTLEYREGIDEDGSLLKQYCRPDGSAHKIEMYNPETNKILGIGYYREDTTIETTEVYDPTTGALLGKSQHNRDGSIKSQTLENIFG
ncbi:MAG: hypothetical protein HAW61_04005 [Candidatus Portiera sp.]|nr:hypothetical protein [Portiera sp.]